MYFQDTAWVDGKILKNLNLLNIGIFKVCLSFKVDLSPS